MSRLKFFGVYLLICGLLYATTIQVLITLGGDVTGAQNATVVERINGTTVPVNAAANQSLITTASAVAAWKTWPDCDDTAGNHINYDNATQTISCGTSGGTASAVPFSGITSATNTSATMTVGSGAAIAFSGTGSLNGQAIAGLVLATRLTGTGTIDFGSITDGNCLASTFTITGAVTGDAVAPAFPSTLETGLFGTMLVSAADTVQVRLCNLSGAPVDPASQTFGGKVVR